MKILVDQKDAVLTCPEGHAWATHFVVLELGGKGSRMRAIRPVTAYGVEQKTCPECGQDWMKTVLEGMPWYNQTTYPTTVKKSGKNS